MVLLTSGLAIALAVPDVVVPGLSLKLGSVGWFCTGMGAAQLALDGRRMPNMAFAMVGISWFMLIVLGAAEKAGYISAIGVLTYLAPVAALVGILFWWGLCDRFSACTTDKLPECFKMTFWVYCLHGVVTSWILASVGYLLGKSEWVTMLASYLSVCGSLVCCLVVAHFVKCRFPEMYAVLSGGR